MHTGRNAGEYRCATSIVSRWAGGTGHRTPVAEDALGAHLRRIYRAALTAFRQGDTAPGINVADGVDIARGSACALSGSSER